MLQQGGATCDVCLSSYFGMATEAGRYHAHSSLRILAIAGVLAAALVFGESWNFLTSNDALHEETARPPSSGTQAQHVIPIGGDVLDGVFRSSGAGRDSQPYPLTTLSRCSDSLPMAGTSASSTLRMSSKL